MGNELLARKKGAENRYWFLDHCFKKQLNLFTKPRTGLNHKTNQEVFETKFGEERNAYL